MNLTTPVLKVEAAPHCWGWKNQVPATIERIQEPTPLLFAMFGAIFLYFLMNGFRSYSHRQFWNSWGKPFISPPLVAKV
jgi:hypothetical protein